MKAKTEELLYLLLWGAEQLCRPTFRSLTDSFEGWAYRHGFHRRLWELERQELLESRTDLHHCRQYRLSERGRILALGGRDPVAEWDRSWDNHWRMVVFDLPETKSATRTRLRRFLKDHGFGYLQNSVWITPHPFGKWMGLWTGDKPNVESIITFEARPGSGESNAAIVAGAWDFDRINSLYARSFVILKQFPRTTAAHPKSREWVASLGEV